MDVLREDLLAQRIEQEAALAVQRTAAHALHKAAQKACSHGRFEQHRAFGGRDLAGAQARERTLCGVAAHRLGRGQLLGRAHGRVPGVALHFGVATGQGRDRCDRDAVARTGVAAPETVRVGAEEVALLGRHRRAFAVGDAATGFEGGGLALQGQFGRLLAGDGPRVEQVQLARIGFDVTLIGQAGDRVLGCETGNVIGRLHGAFNGGLRKVGGAGIATAVAHVHRHTQRFVAVALHVFQLALAHRHGKAAAFGGFGTGIGGAQLFGVLQGAVDQVFKKLAAVAETAVG